jgi:hypothetical protein
MENVLQQIMSQVGDDGIEKMASKIGADKGQTAEALSGILPTLLGSMKGNAQSKEGASSLLNALDRDHDGSIFNNLSGFIQNAEQGPGSGILKHTLGSQQPAVEQRLSAKTGLDSSQISNLLQMAAPILMGFLGKQKRENQGGGFDIGGIASLLGDFTQQADNSTGIDLGDVLSIVGGLSGDKTGSKSSGIGGMLGKFFGR